MGVITWLGILVAAIVTGLLLVMFPAIWLFVLIGFAIVLVAGIITLIARGSVDQDRANEPIHKRRVR